MHASYCGVIGAIMALKSSHRGQVSPFQVMEVLRTANARAAAGQKILHLEIGQPGCSAPAQVLEAARIALKEDKLGYTEALGLPALRQRIADFYQDRYGARPPIERIAVVTGSSAGFVLAFLTAFDAGDQVALAAPGYPAYRNILTSLDLKPVEILSGPAQRFQPTPSLLDQVSGPLDGLILASPSNPAGTMVDAPEMSALATYCQKRGIRLISDEIYHGITYEGRKGVTALTYSSDALIINSFSKYFCMTGWRLGWLIVPEDLIRPLECLMQNLYISAPAIAQKAALAAFDCSDELDANVARYALNRELLLRELPKAGFDRLAPADGAFYLYADIGHLTNDSSAFCARILDELGVAITPGVDFDPARGHSTLRISYAGDPCEIEEAAFLLKNWRR
ncbi:MAG: aminotransferase class I/II-fold pyridoxal phosphate-dependent enzyme [Alphaproteobacteria bacterium]